MIALPLTFRVVIVIAVAGLSAAIWWALTLRPIPLADSRVSRLPCVSYAPFRGAETPFDDDFRVPRERVREDLAALQTLTGCVRTYAVDQGLEAVPEVARELGMKVHLGIWIGRDPVKNREQVEAGIQLANRYSDAIRSVIVGNEVLLRREQPAAALAAFAREVRSRVSVPVTYADVWEFWIESPSLADAVDFVTVHLLPYWEDEPIPVDRAVDHAISVLRRVQALFPGKRLLVGEIGWPARGRMREGARPGTFEQIYFARLVADRAVAEGIDYNFVEAFDQPWKRTLEGTMGGAWGMFDADRRQRVTLAGPVEPSSRALLLAGLAVGLGLLGALATRPREAAATLTAAVLGQILAALIVLTGENVWIDFRTFLERLAGPPWLVVLAAAGFAALDAVVARFDGRRALAPDRLVVVLRFAFLAYAAVVTLEIAVDPRYRDFPIAQTALWTTIVASFRAAGFRVGLLPEERALAVATGAALCLSLAREGLENAQALGWATASAAFLCAVLSFSTRSEAVPAGQPQPTL